MLSYDRITQHLRNTVSSLDSIAPLARSAEYDSLWEASDGTLVLEGASVMQAHETLIRDKYDQLRPAPGEELASIIRLGTPIVRPHQSDISHVVVPHQPLEPWSVSDSSSAPELSLSFPIGNDPTNGTVLVKIMSEGRRPPYASSSMRSSGRGFTTYPKQGVMICMNPLRMCRSGLHVATTDSARQWVNNSRNVRFERVSIAGRIQYSSEKLNAQIMQFGHGQCGAIDLAETPTFRIDGQPVEEQVVLGWFSADFHVRHAFAGAFGESYADWIAEQNDNPEVARRSVLEFIASRVGESTYHFLCAYRVMCHRYPLSDPVMMIAHDELNTAFDKDKRWMRQSIDIPDDQTFDEFMQRVTIT